MIWRRRVIELLEPIVGNGLRAFQALLSPTWKHEQRIYGAPQLKHTTNFGTSTSAFSLAVKVIAVTSNIVRLSDLFEIWPVMWVKTIQLYISVPVALFKLCSRFTSYTFHSPYIEIC